MPMHYAQYQEEVRADIAEVLRLAGCRPILFIGSGFSVRYADAPNGDELLKQLAEKCPKGQETLCLLKTEAHGPTVHREHVCGRVSGVGVG